MEIFFLYGIKLALNVSVFLGLSRDLLRELENILKHYSLSHNSVKNYWHKYICSIDEFEWQEGK